MFDHPSAILFKPRGKFLGHVCKWSRGEKWLYNYLHCKFDHQNSQPLKNRSNNDIALLKTVEDIAVGTRVCNTFKEYPGQFFFGEVTAHFPAENLWHVNYDDEDEEDLTNQEVLDAANLAITQRAKINSTCNHSTPNRTTPAASPSSSVASGTWTSPADRKRELQEKFRPNVGRVRRVVWVRRSNRPKSTIQPWCAWR